MKTLALTLSLFLFATFPAHADITIGLAGPFSGEISMWGLPGKAGALRAIADINETGGINGQKVIAKIYDDMCDPKQAVTVANKIISEKIHFVIHGTCSAGSIASLKTYIDEGTVVLNPFASNPKVTDEGGSNMFRTVYRDDKASLVIADYIVRNESKKKIVILHDKSAYGLGIAQYVKDAINKAGVHEDAFEAYDPTNHDYSAIVTRLKSLGTETVFVGGYPVEEATLLRQLREAGSKAQLIAGDLTTDDFWKIAGTAGEGALFSFPHDPRKEPGAQDVIKHLAAQGIAADGYTLYPYASVQVLVEALAKAGSDNPSKVASYIHNHKFDTILGQWSFDAKGDVNNIHQVMYRWHDGKYAEITQ